MGLTKSHCGHDLVCARLKWNFTEMQRMEGEKFHGSWLDHKWHEIYFYVIILFFKWYNCWTSSMVWCEISHPLAPNTNIPAPWTLQKHYYFQSRLQKQWFIKFWIDSVLLKKNLHLFFRRLLLHCCTCKGLFFSQVPLTKRAVSSIAWLSD